MTDKTHGPRNMFDPRETPMFKHELEKPLTIDTQSIGDALAVRMITY